MAINKVEANGETLIDLTSDTVTADTLVSGRTAHLASGVPVTGTFEPVTGVKGNAESAYRKGNVNLTPANIGAATSEQGAKADSAVQTIQISGTTQTKTGGTVNLPAYPTKSSLGLGNVDNTSDANKPISTATQAEFDKQQAQLDKAIKLDFTTGDEAGDLILPTGIHEIDWDDNEGVIDFSNAVTHFTNSQDILLQSNEIQINCPETDEYGGLYHLSVNGAKANSKRYPAIRFEESSSGNKIDIRNNAITLSGGGGAGTGATPIRGISLSPAVATIYFDTNALTIDSTGLKYNGITLPVANNAGFHNSIYRGKNLGTSYTAAQKAQVQAGTFDDLFVGDYWTINNINWRIAHLDYYLNTGDTATTKHHLVIVPDTILASSYMNSTNVTTGAYAGSYMFTTTLLQDGTEASDSVFGKIKAAFGEENLLSIRQLFANAVDSNGNVSGWAWYNTRCFLMNQCMVYGHKAWANGNNDGYNVGIDKTQLALFAHNPTSINTRQTYWLRDVRGSAEFAIVYNYGNAGSYVASGVGGVRPVFLLKGA